jgi:predicted nucleic acid-binding Zn ribbon protein
MAGNPNKQCEVCGKMVYRNPNIKAHVTCSKECRSILNKQLNGKVVKCDNCNFEFYKKNSRIKEHNFCCSDCQKEYNKPKLKIDEILKLHQKGLYDKEIAEKAKCSREFITKALNENGYNNRRSKKDDVALRNRISKANKGRRTGIDNHNFKGKSDFTNMARGLFNSISKSYMRNHMRDM